MSHDRVQPTSMMLSRFCLTVWLWLTEWILTLHKFRAHVTHWNSGNSVMHFKQSLLRYSGNDKTKLIVYSLSKLQTMATTQRLIVENSIYYYFSVDQYGLNKV